MASKFRLSNGYYLACICHHNTGCSFHSICDNKFPGDQSCHCEPGKVVEDRVRLGVGTGNGEWGMGVGVGTSNLELQTSNFKPRTSNLKPQTSNFEHKTS